MRVDARYRWPLLADFRVVLGDVAYGVAADIRIRPRHVSEGM